MKPEAGRRMFIGSMALGVPLLAGGGVAALAQSGNAKGEAHAHGTSQKDAVFEHLLEQIGRMTQAAKGRGGALTAEEALLGAAYLRTFAVHARELDFDRVAQATATDLVARRGRDTVLYEQPDREKIRTHLQSHGIELDDRFIGVPSQVPYGTRAAALDNLLNSGCTPLFDRAATSLDTAVPRLQHHAMVLQQVQYPSDYAWYMGYCSQLQHELYTLTLTATALCNSYVANPILEPVCLGIYGAIAVLTGAWWYECSWFEYGSLGF